MFFVLSGFLITGILLRARDRADAGYHSRPGAIVTFYIRRFFRIFPLFYMTLAIAWLVGLPEVRDSLAWHLTYMTNVYVAKLEYFPAHIAHLWSLAVEEQFYLVWPFIVIFTPRKRLFPVLALVAAVGPLYRLAGALAGLHEGEYWIWLFAMPFGNIDSLALGGILAYSWSAERDASRAHALIVRPASWIGVPLIVGLGLARSLHLPVVGLGVLEQGFENTLWAFVFVSVVSRAANGLRGLPGRILELRPLLYLGQISYGLYVIHPFVPDALEGVMTRTFAYRLTLPASFFVFSTVTIVLAACSWHLYEKPLNNLKERFSTTTKPEGSHAPAPVAVES